MTTDESPERDYDLHCSFWIDTDAYSDRDRAMFVAGFEFCQVLESIENNEGGDQRTIHKENESRIRMACAKFGRQCTIEPCEPEYDPGGTWSYWTMVAKGMEQ